MKRWLLVPLLVCLGAIPAAANTAPTLVSTTVVAFNTGGSPKSSASISWNAGDLIEFQGGAEDTSAISVPTATGLTFASVRSNSGGSSCASQLATATAASSGSSVITDTYAGGSNHWGFVVRVWRNSNGFGNSAEQHTATKTVALAPLGGADSAISWSIFDFSAAALQTDTPTPTNQPTRGVDSGRYTFYTDDLDDQTGTGSVNYGISGTSSGPFSIVVLEIEGTSSGGGSTPGFDKRSKLDKLDPL